MRTTRLMSSLIPYTTAGRYEIIIKQIVNRSKEDFVMLLRCISIRYP
jgi:hypothetical protein